MMSFCCYDNSNVIVTLTITNFHLYLIQLCWKFFQIFNNGYIVYAQTWQALTLKNPFEPLGLNVQPRCFVGFLPQVNTNTCLIHRCLSCILVVSSVVSLCFICKLINSLKQAFSWNTLLSVTSGNSLSSTPPCLRNSNHKYPLMPSDFQFKEPPCPQNSEKLSVVWYGYFLESPIQCT